MNHRYVPEKASHKLPSLVYVVANSHMYPIAEQSIRESVFAMGQSNSNSKCVFGFKGGKVKTDWNPENKIVVNPSFEEIRVIKDANVVLTNMTTLQGLLLQD